MVMKKIITSVIALLALTGAMFAQTGERLILEKGKTYTFCVRGEENLVLAHYGEEPAFIVEPYEEGNPNQLMAVAYYVDDTEGYTNLYNVGTGYTWSDKGTAVPAAKGQDGEWIRETWIYSYCTFLGTLGVGCNLRTSIFRCYHDVVRR